MRSILAVDYPRRRFRLLVVADNCTDETAARAEEAGATVLVRNDPERRGKGYALAYAFEESLAQRSADAVVVIDADTVVSANLLRAFAARIEHGARAVQADYTVQNPGASWRTRLMTIAFGAFHVLRSRARERLGLSCGLHGNGMCFTSTLLREVPYRAFSLVEDLEYGIRLGEAGQRVFYSGDAHVYGRMPASAGAARSQRQRWEGGRLRMARLHGARLLRRAFARRDAVLLDLAMDLLVPPLSTLACAVGAGLAASAGLALSWGRPGVALFAWGACASFLLVYVVRGWALSGTGARGLLDLLWAPLYMMWKLTSFPRRSGQGRDEWVRTAREAERP